MKSNYLSIVEAVVRRRRRLNMVRGARRGATLALAAILGYLGAVYLGVIPMSESWWLLVIVVGASVLGGARWGRRWDINVQQELYKVDRTFELGEKLSTIHDLRQGRGSARFLRPLYGRLGNPQLDLRRALPLFEEKDRRPWIGMGALSLGVLALISLWFWGVSPLPVQQLISGGAPQLSRPFGQEGQNGADGATAEPEELRSIGEQPRDDGGAVGGQRGAPLRSQIDCDPQEEADRCVETGRGSQASAIGGSRAGVSAETHAGVEALRRALQQLREGFSEGELSLEQLKKRLEQLARQGSPDVREAFERAARAGNEREMQRRLQNLDRTLSDERRNAGRRMSSGAGSRSQQGNEGRSERGASGEGGAPVDLQEENRAGQDGGRGSSGDRGEGRETAGDRAPTSSGERGEASSATGRAENGSRVDDAAGSNRGRAGDEGAGRRTTGNTNRSGGSRPGREPGQGEADGAAEQDRTLTLDEELLIDGGRLSADIEMLEGLLTRGVPLDLAGEGVGGSATLRLNLERVESLLDLRNLPPEMRSLVRDYFLAIAEQE